MNAFFRAGLSSTALYVHLGLGLVRHIFEDDLTAVHPPTTHGTADAEICALNKE